MNLGRKEFKGRRIDILHYDTGAMIYERLKSKGKHFLGWTFYDFENFCKHYCGVTRAKMYENEPVATKIEDLNVTITTTLKEKYNFDLNSFYVI